MPRRKSTPPSSFDLFLDTVCNTFGGVLFIAILIAIQIRQTAEQPPPEACSPERIAELARRADELVVEIESATMLMETVRKTMPEPVDEKDKKLVTAYSELLEKKDEIVSKKSELTRDGLKQFRENAELEQRLKKIEDKLEELKETEARLAKIVQELQSEQRNLEQKTDDMKAIAARLEAETTNKTDRVRDKNDPDKNSRKEELFLPKMQDSGSLRPFYLVLRYNRLYAVVDRGDFTDTGPRGKDLGVPKRSRGFVVEENDTVKRKIRDLFRLVLPNTHYIGIFVYGDSVDVFYVIRNAATEAGFRYELIPTTDDAHWSFGEGSGSTQIQ